MSEMKHTHGPWKWSDAYTTQSGERTLSLLGAGGYGILSCDGLGNSPLGVTGEANARLIAAAPDLLEALLLALPLLEDHFASSDASAYARAALAKAQGHAHD